MAEHVIDAQVRSGAPPQRVFDILSDVATWTQWGIWTSTSTERHPDDADDGTGVVRVLTSRTFGRTVVARELVTKVEPGAHMSYTLLSGLPLHDYRGDIDLTPDGDGTLIRWTCRFDRAAPGTTWFYRAFFRRFIPRLARQLAQYAETHPASA